LIEKNLVCINSAILFSFPPLINPFTASQFNLTTFPAPAV